jgi:carbon storage regulator CsrA
MLVLTREVGEQIIIDGDICITIVAIRGNKVRLRITAPEQPVVDRNKRRKPPPPGEAAD